MFHCGEVESGAGKDPGTENRKKLENCFHRNDSSTSRQQVAKYWARKLGKTPRAKAKHPGALLTVYCVLSIGWYTPRTSKQGGPPVRKYLAEFLGTFVLVF